MYAVETEARELLRSINRAHGGSLSIRHHVYRGQPGLLLTGGTGPAHRRRTRVFFEDTDDGWGFALRMLQEDAPRSQGMVVATPTLFDRADRHMAPRITALLERWSRELGGGPVTSWTDEDHVFEVELAEGAAVARITLMDSATWDGTPGGLNVMFELVADDGEGTVLAQVVPHNYTDQVWTFDLQRLESRFREYIESIRPADIRRRLVEAATPAGHHIRTRAHRLRPVVSSHPPARGARLPGYTIRYRTVHATDVRETFIVAPNPSAAGAALRASVPVELIVLGMQPSHRDMPRWEQSASPSFIDDDVDRAKQAAQRAYTAYMDAASRLGARHRTARRLFTLYEQAHEAYQRARRAPATAQRTAGGSMFTFEAVW